MNIIKPTLSIKHQKKEWINLLVHVHDLQCRCDKPLEHTADIIFEEPALRLEKSTIENIKKCQDTTAITPVADALDGIDEGDLSALFAEDFTEENG